MKRAILFGVLMIASGVFPLVSCSKQEKQKETKDMTGHGMAADWKFTLPAGDPAAGRKVFIEAECYKCPEVKGATFPAMTEGEKGVGPELSQMAGMHPIEFFAESIIDPNTVIDPDAKEKGYLGEDGKSKMPAYVDLAAYFASLKAQEHKTQ